MFKAVKEMNEAFGNPEGDPSNIDREKLLRQCQNIGSEFQELMLSLGIKVNIEFETPLPIAADPNYVNTRDALCDIMVFALGAFHFMGVDAERDMASVLTGVMTRFCRDELELTETRLKFTRAGVQFTEHGEFPRKFLRSAKDQQMPEYPKGKFLKSVGYSQPVFYPLQPVPAAPQEPELGVVDAMAVQREQENRRRAEWQAYRAEVVAQLIADLDGMQDQAQRDGLVDGELLLVFNCRRLA